MMYIMCFAVIAPQQHEGMYWGQAPGIFKEDKEA